MQKKLFFIRTALFIFFIALSFSAYSQFDKKKDRTSQPQKVTGRVEGIKVDISYNSPEVKGRQIFGGLVSYGKVWRTGANEATNIEFSEDVFINGKLLKKGKYALFTIPNPNEWIFIFNKEYDQWGDFNYDPNADALRVIARAEKTEFHEKMEFKISENKLVLYWDNLMLPINLSKSQ